MNWQNLTENLAHAEISVFGEDITYQAGNASFSIKGIFNLNSVDVDQDTGFAVLGNQPNLGIRNSDLNFTIKIGDTVTIRNVSYTIKNIDRDGESMTHLQLYKV